MSVYKWRVTNIEDCRTVSAQNLSTQAMVGAVTMIQSLLKHENGCTILALDANGCYPEGSDDMVWNVVLDFDDDAASCDKFARLLGA